MKYYKIKYIIFFLLLPFMNWGQFVQDPVLINLRLAYNLEIGVATAEKGFMEDSYKNLARVERDYQDRIPTFDGSVAASSAAFVAKLGQLESLARTIDNELLALPRIPLLINLSSELQTERDYLAKIRNDINIADATISSPRLSGGVGHSINYYMKAYLRCKTIESKLLELEYRKNNLYVLKDFLRK